ncbi:hypothetical protein [Anaerotalea alkaliphila]|nr:hypothetical protein [Anaerotalea alkaliphila]
MCEKCTCLKCINEQNRRLLVKAQEQLATELNTALFNPGRVAVLLELIKALHSMV